MIQKVFDWFREKSKLVDENMKIRKGKFDVEQKYNQMLEDIDTITLKYTSLLEEKSTSFNLYVKYQSQCVDLANDKRELKKQVALLTEQNSHMADIIEDYDKQNTKLKKKVSQLEKNIKC